MRVRPAGEWETLRAGTRAGPRGDRRGGRVRRPDGLARGRRPEGPPCGCGGRGCLEAMARGPGLAAWALSQGWTPGTGARPAGTYVEAAEASGRQRDRGK
ncbi:ROK family protein [Sphaerisporangium sp. NBC_01403]|uniref:ROK family protein n=1 Tax=Sphaerisporangium sp. NBC_01403 TaxID=2903599 RepID=UPI003863E0FD